MKVSKANFRPPPQVDSCVVRIVPKQGSERPTISFEEFDGLLRIVSRLHFRFLTTAYMYTVLQQEEQDDEGKVGSSCPTDETVLTPHSWLGTKEVLVMLEKVSSRGHVPLCSHLTLSELPCVGRHEQRSPRRDAG
jgi:ribosomal RNA adenine dimethylase